MSCNIKSLSLKSPFVTFKGCNAATAEKILRQMASNNTVTSLDLTGHKNIFTGEQIANMLKRNRKLKTLNLQDVVLKDRGKGITAIGKLLDPDCRAGGENRTLEHLIINQFYDEEDQDKDDLKEEMKNFQNGLSKNKYLKKFSCINFDSPGHYIYPKESSFNKLLLPAIKKSTLEYLDFTHTSEILTKDMEELVKNKKLKVLKIGGGMLGKNFEGSENYRPTYGYSKRIGSFVLAAALASPSLEELYIRDVGFNPRIWWDDITTVYGKSCIFCRGKKWLYNAFKNNKTLKKLDLSNLRFVDEPPCPNLEQPELPCETKEVFLSKQWNILTTAIAANTSITSLNLKQQDKQLGKPCTFCLVDYSGERQIMNLQKARGSSLNIEYHLNFKPKLKF